MTRHVTRMTIEDAEHYTAEQRAAIIASYPAHEREARAKGVPMLGSGRVFPLSEDDVKCAPFKTPDHWPVLGALDFGWDHPTAAIKLAWDRDSDCVYVTNAYRVKEATPLIHSAALKAWGEMPWAWPHDGLAHDKGSGEPLKDQYAKHGMKMLFEHAQFEDGSTGVEAGLMLMLDRMQTSRLKVFSNLGEWFEEMMLYHRKDGLVVKEMDDLMAATRYGIMCLRFAAVPKARDRRRSETTARPSGPDGYSPLRW